MPTWNARVLPLLGLVVAASLAAASGLVLSRKLHGTEADQIEARYGSRIVSVARTIPEGRFVTDVAEFASLVHVADSYERLILHSHDGGRDVYVVDDGVAVYRYTAGGASAERRTSPRRGVGVRVRARRSLMLPLAGLLACVMVAVTATNVVAASKRRGGTETVSPTQLAPPECAGMVLTAVVVGNGGGVSGQPTLIVGTPGNDNNLNGGNGNDCILGGAGNDNLKGNNGTDVCIGGPGTDTAHASCEIRYGIP